MGTKGEKTKELIVTEATKLFATNGYTAVTINDICEACALIRGGLYQHFSSTKEIFLAMLSADKQDWHQVETGVRAIYIPTGLAVVSTEARSQQMNKKLAMNRLCEVIAAQNQQGTEQVKALNRLEHARIQRGDLVRVYEGIKFVRIK